MTNNEIIAYMRENPNLEIPQIAFRLQIDTMKVTEAQLYALKTLKRNSPLWNGDKKIISK